MHLSRRLAMGAKALAATVTAVAGSAMAVTLVAAPAGVTGSHQAGSIWVRVAPAGSIWVAPAPSGSNWTDVTPDGSNWV